MKAAVDNSKLKKQAKNEVLKVLFVCGSLEPGKDGVGDYTRRIAVELSKKGHQAQMLSINDKHLQEVFEGQQQFQEIVINVLRVPSVYSWKRKLTLAKEWINRFDPVWLSLQYVPFSFDSRGLHFNLGNFLKSISGSRKWHIMFHELWVGMHRQASAKHILWGVVQLQLIRSLNAKLRPLAVHTQVHLYQKELRRLGISASLLPLFSNIERVGGKAEQSSSAILREENDEMTLVLFGGIHPDAPIEQFAREANLYQNETGKHVRLVLVGRCGSEQARWQNVWQNNKLDVLVLGEQNPAEISKQLAKANFGIATTPLLLLEKSGSVAAMHQHGLPVICVSKPWDVRKVKGQQLNGIVEYKPGTLTNILNTKTSTPTSVSIEAVCSEFEKSLLLAQK